MAANDATTPEAPSTVLSDAECLDRLSTQTVGRLVLNTSGRIEVFPVNFVIDLGTIIFRTAEGTKLVELTMESEVVFEADEVSTDWAWSVVVHGTARRLQSSSEIASAEALNLHSLLPTLKDHYVK
ncbi:MAG: pyridoxamine 5'-phosphate oxidase family protein, partial [Mycobacteriaceae bacterium]